MSGHGQDYPALVGAAPSRHDPVTLALAGVIALAPCRMPPYDVPIAGLDRIALSTLRDRFFSALPFSFMPDRLAAGGAARSDEFDDLLALLLEHRTIDNDESRWLAHAIATASMGANHLWQDMGLPDRGTLSWLMTHHFTPLAMRNAGDMKWKKFFYRQLCEQADLFICRSPSCGVCTDYSQCFGPEEGSRIAIPGLAVPMPLSEVSA
jgi:nitrogen fixation protein NifQ